MRIVVTGGSGKAGRWVVADLRDRDHDVVNLDVTHDGTAHGLCVITDLTDYGETVELITGADAVVHLAAVPAPGLRAEAETFRNNIISTYNVFAAAVASSVKRVVWASSETVLGLPFDTPPEFAPIDETITPHPESSYALSKLLGEEMASQFSRRSGIPFVGLRISNIMEPPDYESFPDSWNDPHVRKWNLWGYVDVRDVAAAIRAGLDAEIAGSEIFIVAAADTVMPQPSAELMAAVFPDVPLRRPVEGRETLLSIERARRMLGYEPQHRWEQHVTAGGV
jgi:nucleoside-diphosphate-sugar epimerase